MAEIDGREIQAYRLKEDPNFYFIDVLQNDGDCPKGYDKKGRLFCPLDCQNNYTSSVFSLVHDSIIVEMALLQKIFIFFPEARSELPQNLSQSDIEQMILDENPLINIRKGETGSKIYSYKGIDVADYHDCALKQLYQELDETRYGAPAKYLKRIREDPKFFLSACGIDIFNKDGLGVVTLGKNNLKEDLNCSDLPEKDIN